MGIFIDLLLIASTAFSGWYIWKLQKQLQEFRDHYTEGVTSCWNEIKRMDSHFVNFVKKHNELVGIVEAMEKFNASWVNPKEPEKEE